MLRFSGLDAQQNVHVHDALCILVCFGVTNYIGWHLECLRDQGWSLSRQCTVVPNRVQFGTGRWSGVVEAGKEVYKPKLALGVHGVDHGRSWSRRCTEDPSRVQCGTRRWSIGVEAEERCASWNKHLLWACWWEHQPDKCGRMSWTCLGMGNKWPCVWHS